MILKFKAGCDGCSNQVQYQHKPQRRDDSEDHPVDNNHEDIVDDEDDDDTIDNDSDGDIYDDSDGDLNLESGEHSEDIPTDYSSVFIVSFVPLQLSLPNRTIWENNLPSSIRFCRPFEFKFMKESRENVWKIYQDYRDKFANLSPKKVAVGHGYCTVDYDVEFTMIDGKTCNVLTGQKASSNCNICDARPTEMNDFAKLGEKKSNQNTINSDCLPYIAGFGLWNRY